MLKCCFSPQPWQNNHTALARMALGGNVRTCKGDAHA